LDLSFNQLSALPPEIGQLKALKSLDISINNIKTLQPEISQFKMNFLIDKSSWSSFDPGFHLNGNPLEIPPIEIVKQGREAVIAYFEEIEKEETTRLFEAKLLIVGQGEVGKTYLMNRLVKNRINPKTISTEGIDINQWKIKTKQTDNFQVNFWDFGGQEIYHATHQFFLTKRSLYLFVWVARTDADLVNFEYWLNTIKLYGGDSPVIVIQNKIDERTKLINQENWKKRFPNIVAFHDVSAKVGTGANELRKTIIQEIEKLPHIGDLLPKRWTDIRKKLESLEKNDISYKQYQDICREFGMDEVQTDRLSEYYHHLGVFLHFKDNPVLRNTVFLNPEWATNAVYKIADNKKVKDKNFGKFSFSDLGNIWKDRTVFPEDKYVDLIELMKSFELCFELPVGKKYIIPELLRTKQPKFEWDEADNLRFKYQYNFMPAGIISRFIAISNDLIKDDLYWKDGVVLIWESTEAQIKKRDNQIIDILIKGDDKKALLAIIRRHMAYINSSENKNLEVDEMVPCLCHECQTNPLPYFYPYENIMKARQKKKNSIECQKSFDQVAIENILSGIGVKDKERRGLKKETIKLFLASSAEIKEEREKIELLIGKENRRLHYQNIFLDLVIWEDLKLGFNRKGRIQDYFNEKMLECDIVNLMFFKKVGDYTREEFDVAYQNFKEGKNPRYLYVYFKSGKVDIDEIDEEILKIKSLKKEIAEAEQIYNSFTSNEDLILQLKNQLDMIIPEMVY
jgi:small GTP-binding protein